MSHHNLTPAFIVAVDDALDDVGFHNVRGTLRFIFGVLLVTVATIALGVLITWRAWVLKVLWGWFVTPALGLAVPSLPLLMGLCLVTGMMTRGLGRSTPIHTGKTDGWAPILAPLFALFTGWIITFFI